MARTTNKLTAAAVDAAQHTGRDIKLFDGGGLYVLVKPQGKYWRLKYRYGGKEKALALGVHPTVSLKAARHRRDQARALLEQGMDPGGKRLAARQAALAAATDTFKAVARVWWERVHRVQVVPAHSGRDLRRLELHLFPAIGSRPIGALTPRELLEALQRVAEDGKASTALRLLSLCTQIYRYAAVIGRVERDVTADLRRALPSAAVQHLPAVVAPEAIGALLRAIDRYSGHPYTRHALQLAPLLFVRPGELRQAEWKDIDLDAGEWNYTPSKGGTPVVVPLCRQAVAILQSQQKLSGHQRYVFPSTLGGGKPMSGNTLGAALQALGYRGTMTVHGFRAMARTVLAEKLGFPAEYIEQQLAHAVRDPLGRAYNRTTFLAQRREMMQRWADYLDELRQA